MPLPVEQKPTTDFSQGLRRLQNRDYLTTLDYQEQQWRAKRAIVIKDEYAPDDLWIRASPQIVEFEEAFVAAMRKMGIPFYCHNMVRTHAEQAQLYRDGVSNARAGQSPHNYGCAGDFVHSLYHWDLTKQEWTIVGHVGKEVAKNRGIKIVWGGDWKRPYDPAHWELAGWKNQPSNVYSTEK